MPINVFGNSSNISEQKIDTSLFVQKPYLRTDYIEANFEEDITLKNQYKNKNLPDPTNLQDACSKNYVDIKFNDPSIIKNTAHVDFNDKNLDNVRFVKVNSMPAVGEHLTAKYYVDNEISIAVDESSFVRNNKDNDFSSYNLTNINSIALNKQAENENEVIRKAYVDQVHQENERSRRDVGLSFYNEEVDLVKNNQDNNLIDNKLINLDSVQVNRIPSSDNEVAKKKYIDDELDKNTIVRFSQTLSNYLKVTVGNDTYNLAKYDKINITDTTIINFPNEGKYLLQKWNIVYSDINGNGKLNNILKSTKTSSPTSQSGATTLPPIGKNFMYIETSSGGHGNNVFVSFEGTDIIQITNITFYYNRFSILTNNSLKSMGRFRSQILLEDNTWSTRYNIPKNDRYSDNSTDWTLVSLNFTVKNYGIKLIYDQIDTPHADMCFSYITVTHSVY